MALRVARGCDDVATTRPCVRVPGVRVARLAGFDPKARSDLRSGQKRADTHGGASSATRRSERRAAAGLVCVPWIIAIESTKTLSRKTRVLAGALKQTFSRKTQHYSFAVSAVTVSVQIRDAAAFRGAARSQDTGPSGSASGLGLNSHPASSAVRTARCVLRRIVCRVVKTHSRTVVAGTLQQQKQHHHD